MKKIILLIVAVIAMAVPASADSKGGKAKIQFEEYTYDFGVIKEANGSVSHEFVFTNTGTANLVITDVTATCGCTRPEYPQEPIAPGKKGKIKVTFNPLARPGAVDRTITVKTNGSPKKVRLKIKGNVLPEE